MLDHQTLLRGEGTLPGLLRRVQGRRRVWLYVQCLDGAGQAEKEGGEEWCKASGGFHGDSVHGWMTLIGRARR